MGTQQEEENLQRRRKPTAVRTAEALSSARAPGRHLHRISAPTCHLHRETEAPGREDRLQAGRGHKRSLEPRVVPENEALKAGRARPRTRTDPRDAPSRVCDTWSIKMNNDRTGMVNQ